MDPGEKGPSWMLWEMWDPARHAGEERTVGVRQWRRLDVHKMLEGTGGGLGTTSSHVYAQSTYHMCIVCLNSLRLNNHDCEPCFTVLYLSVSGE